MEFVRKSACWFVILLLGSAPLLACALPGQEMTAAEQECCLQMQEQCGHSQMADSHSCCNQAHEVVASTMQTTGKYTPAPPDALQQPAAQAMLVSVVAIPSGHQRLSDDSPSPPSSITILRT